MASKFSQVEIDKDVFNVQISFSDLSIDKKKIGLSIGYVNGTLPSHTEEIINEISTQLYDKMDIRAGYRIIDLYHSKEQPHGLLIGGKFFNTDKIITSQLKKSNKAAIFLCTIGNQMENWSKQLISEGDQVKSYLVDVIASGLVESTADCLHDHIGYEMEKYGWHKTNRYSPGYCNWSVTEQQKIFSFFPKNFCNIKLTDSSLMIPIKSISGVIGLGSEVNYAEYICDRCGIKDCTHRVYILSKQKNKIS